jgi:1-acyl-sn-glycerol-3-phosphate acyltransferase
MTFTYRAGHLLGQFIRFCTTRTHVLDDHFAERDGGYLLALTHLSHLDPIAAGILSNRPIDWITRKEFYKYHIFRGLLDVMGAIKIDRQGVSVSAIREAIARVRRGRVVGICPEGRVTCGTDAMFRGGPVKRGVCSIAIRGGVPIVPCVMLGTDKLNCVGPWLPARRATIWVAYGRPIFPPAGARSTRATRAALAARLSGAYVELYGKLRAHYGIRDEDVS